MTVKQLILLSALTLSLSACIINVGVPEEDTSFEDAAEVSVSSDFGEVARQDSVAPNETKYYRVNLPEAVAADNDIVIVEAKNWRLSATSLKLQT